MRNLHIENSYTVWLPSTMRKLITEKLPERAALEGVEVFLNRPMKSLYIEWWLHNIGYYLTKPFKHSAIIHINNRCKDVDLKEWKKEK